MDFRALLLFWLLHGPYRQIKKKFPGSIGHECPRRDCYRENHVPETVAHSAETVKIELEDKSVNMIETATSGAVQGVKVAAIVGAMLIAFCMGIGSSEILKVGTLIGTKLSVNEFVA